MTSGDRGANAWVDAVTSWTEYGNPHTVMGKGDLEDYQADFLISGKAVFDWVDDSNFEVIDSTDCDPSCGP